MHGLRIAHVGRLQVITIAPVRPAADDILPELVSAKLAAVAAIIKYRDAALSEKAYARAEKALALLGGAE